MRKYVIIILGIASTIVVVVFGYLEFLHVTFVDRTIKKYTHTNDYKLIQKVHDDHQWYAKIVINKDNAEGLLRLYPFKYGYNSKVIAGKTQNVYIKDCPKCWYYFDDKGHGIYGYLLYCLSEDKNHLEIYEEFGD